MSPGDTFVPPSHLTLQPRGFKPQCVCLGVIRDCAAAVQREVRRGHRWDEGSIPVSQRAEINHVQVKQVRDVTPALPREQKLMRTNLEAPPRTKNFLQL